MLKKKNRCPTEAVTIGSPAVGKTPVKNDSKTLSSITICPVFFSIYPPTMFSWENSSGLFGPGPLISTFSAAGSGLTQRPQLALLTWMDGGRTAGEGKRKVDAGFYSFRIVFFFFPVPLQHYSQAPYLHSTCTHYNNKIPSNKYTKGFCLLISIHFPSKLFISLF